MKKDENIKIELTGNPFVDKGIAVISALRELDDVTQLTVADIKSVYDDGSQLTEWNSKLKTFTQIFGTNNPLFQPSYGFKKGIGPSEINKKVYKNILKGLLCETGKSGKGPKCWACGSPSDFDFANGWAGIGFLLLEA
jgi:Leucine-rich repeat (LRR) protein